MSTFLTALQRIQHAGFEISLVGDTFTVRPASRLTTEQRNFLKTHKAEIIEALATKDNNPAPEPEENPPRLNPKHRAAIVRWLAHIGDYYFGA